MDRNYLARENKDNEVLKVKEDSTYYHFLRQMPLNDSLIVADRHFSTFINRLEYMDFARAMAKLCASADIICPNLTEASFLLNIPYTTQYTESYIQDILKRLTDFGCNTAILTGVSLEKGMLGAYGYDAKQDMYFKYFIEEEVQHFHGTGDIWASTLCGALLNGKTLQESIALASDFVKDSIHKTLLEPDHNIYGVNFEKAIYGLLKRLYNEQ